MKILCVIDSLGPGGAQRQLVYLAEGLRSRGHFVEIFTYYAENHYSASLAKAGVNVHLFEKNSRYSVAPILHLRRCIQEGNFDFVVSFLDTPNFYAEIASIGLGDVQIVVSKRSSYPKGRLPLRTRVVQELHRLSDWITVNSHHQRERMEREFVWMRGKIQTIYNGVDLESFQDTSPREKTPNVLCLLAVSSVSFNKNSINIAKAVALSKSKHGIDVKVDWVGLHNISGEGNRPANETSGYLEKNGIVEQWNWLGVRDDISSQLANHDALIHASYFESLPNVICEALASGRPVLASRVCDNHRLVEDGVSGFLFDPASPDSIAAAIRALNVKTSSERQRMGQAAREYAETHLSLERFIDAYEQLFRELSTEKSIDKNTG